MTEVLKVGRRNVPITHPDKVMFPAIGLTKLELARYYGEVAGVMVPHLRGRPVSMQVFPTGVTGKGHYAKNVPSHFPDWMRRIRVPKRGGTVTHAVCDDAATLVYLAGQNVVTPHRAIVSRSAAPSNRGWFTTNAVAPAIHGANTLLHACLAQPGEEMLRWTSPGSSPIQYIVDRCPTGYEACVCSTSFGRAVVPEVK